MKNRINIFTLWLLLAAVAFGQTTNVQKGTGTNNLTGALNTGTQTITANDGGIITYSGTGTINSNTLQTYTPATLPVSTATQTALDAKVPYTIPTGTTFTVNGATYPTTVFVKGEAPTGFSLYGDEMGFTNNAPGLNVAYFRNKNINGISAITFRDYNNYEKMAIGYILGDGSFTHPDTAFIEASDAFNGNSGKAPQLAFLITSTYDGGTIGGQSTRQLFRTDGTIRFFAWDNLLSTEAGNTKQILGIDKANPQITIGNSELSSNLGTYDNEIWGCDVNNSIALRAGPTPRNRNKYYSYGGTLANGDGHLFYTGGTRSYGSDGSQTLKFQISDDASSFYQNLFVGGYVTSNPSSGWATFTAISPSSDTSAAASFQPAGTLSTTNPTWFIGHRFNAQGPLSIWKYNGSSHEDNSLTLTTNGVLSTPGGYAGNANTATALATARTINGVSFDGTANINCTDQFTTVSTPTTGSTLTGSATVGTELLEVEPAGTIAALTINLESTDSLPIGTVKQIAMSQVVTALTIAPSGAGGGSIKGNAVTAGVVNGSYAFKKIASKTWRRLY